MKVNRVEIVTVSESGTRINWRTNQQVDIQLSCLSSDESELHVAHTEILNDRHFIGIFNDLENDTKYKFQIKTGSTVVYEGSFSTLKKPPGDFKFRFATINDIHIGEEVYGLIFLPGIKWPPLTPGLKLHIDGAPFWQYTNEAVVRELNNLELDFIIVKGDLVTDHTEKNIRTARKIIDSLNHPCYVLRGNHDRVGNLAEDYFKNTFEVGNGWQSFEHKGAGFLLLDNINPKSGNTAFSKNQLEWFEKEMTRLENFPVFVYMHNPPLRLIERSLTNRINEFLRIIDKHPNVAGVFYGHTHANKRIIRQSCGKRVPFVETAATMDYPGGYNLYDVYSGGYMQTCIRPHDERCYKWFELNEKAYYGLASSGLFGSIFDRNFTWELPV